ncbi:hypothetical protein CYMTET_50520 [Cymbomonas tetramitiformis]|uniref:Uncharacterized protein n=1 Tax=Cymbomonas tetramitiformis TaxID=36881 RepID=A0AAE0BMW2_9CHLO|nr:hypothetical protein CYMTET_50520 [Cymbomonas tetramitiformis]
MLSAVAQDLDAVAGLDNDLGTGSPWDFLTETAAVPRSPSSPVHQRPASVPVSERYDSYGRLKPAARARLSLLPGLSHENVVAAYKPKPRQNAVPGENKRAMSSRHSLRSPQSPIPSRPGTSTGVRRTGHVSGSRPGSSPTISTLRQPSNPGRNAPSTPSNLTFNDDLPASNLTFNSWNIVDTPAGALPAIPSQNLAGGMHLRISRPPSAASSRGDEFQDVDEPTPRKLYAEEPPSTRPADSALAAEFLLADIPARVEANKGKIVSVDGWCLGERPNEKMRGSQLLAVPRDVEQAANAGSHESPMELAARLTKRLAYEVSQPSNSQQIKDAAPPNTVVLPSGPSCGEQTLNLSNSKLGPRQVCALALALPMHKFVTTVILSKNKIDDVCCEMLTAGLRLHAVTKHLDVSYNALTHKGAKLISNLLKRSQDGPHPFKPVMESLNIERNQVGDRGISILSENLSSHLSTLKHFNIAKCGVGPRPMDCRHVHFLVWMTFGSRRACLRGLANGKHAGLGGDFT